MPEQRPDPGDLLRRVKLEESRHPQKRGRLKVFFGMAPGVGKTYAMLTAAQRLAREGVDVVVGVVETHGRSETEQALLGLDILPRARVTRAENTAAPDATNTDPTVQVGTPVPATEFDLDGAIERKPELLLIDELAHTNLRGTTASGAIRNEKRWRDVQECLSAGINVYTTLNVQHIESLNDIVAQITGVRVRETIPDSVIEETDEIELVDLPPDALLQRMRAGKVYIPEVMRQAIDPNSGFFRKGNLTALRELALRRTAEWVDTRVREYKDDSGIRAVWPTAERILVAVSPSPSAPRLVRAAKRLAAGLRAELHAVYVTPRQSGTSSAPSDRDTSRVQSTLRLAESLGAQVTTLTADDHGPQAQASAAALVSFARKQNINRIIVGRTERSRLHEAIFGTFAGEVIREAREIEVSVLSADESDIDAAASNDVSEKGSETRPIAVNGDIAHTPHPITPYLWSTALAVFATLVCRLLLAPLDPANLVMVYLATVIIAAARFGRGPAILTTVLGVAAFDFFFVPPQLTFAVGDIQYLLTFAVMLAVGLLISTLTTRLKNHAESARKREHRAAALYTLSNDLGGARSGEEAALIGARHAAILFDSDTVVAVRSDNAPAGVDVLAHSGNGPDWLDSDHGRDRAVARWLLDHPTSNDSSSTTSDSRQAAHAGFGARSLPAASGRFVALNAAHAPVAILGLCPRTPEARAALLTPDRLSLLNETAHAIASAMERLHLIHSQQQAALEIETERLRTALLSSVSHDLRTPLATIAGAASTLADPATHLDDPTRRELTDSIVTEAERLNDLIANLMFATRLESAHSGPNGKATLELNREWTTIEEIVGVGLSRHRAALSQRPFRVGPFTDLPMLRVDNAMLPQVISNLVENALRYTPDGSPIAISAWVADGNLVIKVADEGPGIPERDTEHAGRARIFERFYRGHAASTQASTRSGGQASAGLGLGLTICKGIIEAHGGRIWAEPTHAAPPRGASFFFSLPIEYPQPSLSIPQALAESPSSGDQS